MRPKCTLKLTNGEEYEGQLIGAPLEASGELVFTTGMVGYSEALTDPSYFGQILVFTYPLIGNYGIPHLNDDYFTNPEALIPRGFESAKIHTSAVIVTVDSPEAFHWNSYNSLDSWLKEQKVPGIIGLDTRHLVHQVRNNIENKDRLLGRVVPEKAEGRRILSNQVDTLEKAQGMTHLYDPGDFEIMGAVSTDKRILLGNGSVKIGLVDCGVKWNIVRQLIDEDCQVELLPWNTNLEDVDCDGWLVSNGPGDPTKTGDLTHRLGKILEKEKPVLGICLGHQLVALAAGAKTRRMPYGHRSHNQPVFQVGTRHGYITSQNHGYVVEENSLPNDWEAWFLNANDKSIEGIRHKMLPHQTVQFHPEAAGGPRDTGWIMRQFIDKVKSSRSTNAS